MNTTKIQQESKFQDQMLQNYEFYKVAFELSKDPKLVLEDCVIVRFNPATMKLFECDDPHAIYMHKLKEFLPEELKDNGWLSEKCAGSIMLETEIKTCKNNWISVSISFDNISSNGKHRTIATIHDISDRIKIKRELEDANEFMYNVMQNLPIGISVRQFSTKESKYMNKHFPDIMGWPEEVCKNFDEYFKKAYPKKGEAEAIRRSIDNALQKNEVVHWGNIKMEDSEGRERMLDMHVFTVPEQDLFVALVRNVTQEIKDKNWLKVKNEIVKKLPNPVVITDPDGRIVWVNRAFTKMYGYSLGECTGQTPRILKSGKYEDAFYEDMWNTIKAGKVWIGNIINKRKDGTTVEEKQIIFPIRVNDREITYFVAIKNLTSEELDYIAK